MEMGTGKTLVALEIFKALRETDRKLRLVVVAPLSLLEAAWGGDIRKFTGFTYLNLHDSKDFDLAHDIYLVNYEGLLHGKLSMVQALCRTHMLVLDESSKIKNYKSKITKTLLAMRTLPKYRLVMSGTPAPNTPMEYWAQMEFLQEGLLHRSFFGYRNTYFHLERNGQRMQLHGQVMSREMMRNILSKGWKYDITKESLAKVMQKVNSVTFWAKKRECLDLPEQVNSIRLVGLNPEQAKAYKEMRRDLITFIKNEAVTAQVALAKAMKLREITSGFAFSQFGSALPLGKSAKITELLEVVEEAGNQPILIWGVFKWDIVAIKEALEEAYGAGCCRTLYSDTYDPSDSIVAFQQGACRFLIANPASAAHGLTFVNCSLQVFFSMDYSWERYEQARCRIHRIGQANKCTYVHLLAAGTIDEDIYAVLQRKGDMNELVYRLKNESHR
jgi:SNF2 family DNA or RNA helicase